MPCNLVCIKDRFNTTWAYDLDNEDVYEITLTPALEDIPQESLYTLFKAVLDMYKGENK